MSTFAEKTNCRRPSAGELRHAAEDVAEITHQQLRLLYEREIHSGCGDIGIVMLNELDNLLLILLKHMLLVLDLGS